MELWIRNQDRDILTKVESFCCVNNTIVCLPTRLDCSTDLGTYKTPERALEVLNEIQQFLLNQHEVNSKFENDGGFLNLFAEEKINVVYEMPEE